MPLKTVKNDTQGHGYCGPTAIAGVTGRKLSVILNTIWEVRYGPRWRSEFRKDYGYSRRPSIRGLPTGTLIRTFEALGWRARGVPVEKPATIERWIKEIGPERRKGYHVAIIETDRGPHWVALSGSKVTCAMIGGDPVPVKSYRHRADPITEVYRVERIC